MRTKTSLALAKTNIKLQNPGLVIFYGDIRPENEADLFLSLKPGAGGLP